MSSRRIIITSAAIRSAVGLVGAAVGEGARVVELDAEDGSSVAWEAEVIDSEGGEHDVLLDVAGNVIDAPARLRMVSAPPLRHHEPPAVQGQMTWPGTGARRAQAT
jgi:hypothetical protein